MTNKRRPTSPSPITKDNSAKYSRSSPENDHLLDNLKKSQTKKDSFSSSEMEVLRRLSIIQDQVTSAQKSIALLFQVLPDKIREGIISGLKERNRIFFPE